MEPESKTVVIPKYTEFMNSPTRLCIICFKPENPEATFATGEAWLCPECRSRLKKLLYGSE